MVARGAGAAGPLLLACRQWDPLELARRLPSLGVGAWRSAPLLPWRVQYPVRVCAALAAGSGGSGWYLVLCLSRFPLPAPGVLHCVWRAVLSGSPLPSLAGTPFHAVCPFREPFWQSPRALCVCVRSRSRGVRSPSPLGGVACAPHAFPALCAGRAVQGCPCPSACHALVPCSVCRAWGGVVRSRFPPTWLGAVAFVCLGARPACPGCGRCGRGDPAPAPQRAPLQAGVARCGSGGRVSPGGLPSTIVRGVWCQALSLPRPPILWSRQPGFRDPCVPGAVGAGVGTQHRPHSVRPCGPALLAVGVAGGRPQGGCLPPI